MGLVGNDGKTLALCSGQLANHFQREREGLDGANHNLLLPRKCFGKFAALTARIAFDGGHDSFGAFKILDGLAKLPVDHVPVRNDNHRIENLFVVGIVQVAQEVGRPGDRLCLAAARRVLNQVLLARSFFQHFGQQVTSYVKLMETGEDDLLDVFLFVTLGDQITAKDVQPAISLPNILPEVGRLVPVRVCRVAFPTVLPRPVAALVEGQEVGSRSGQPGCHLHLAATDGEMHQCTAGEREQRLRVLAFGVGYSVEAILVNRIVNVLGEVGFQFDRGHGDAVEEKNQVDAVFVVQRVTNLPHHPQSVVVVSPHDVGVHGQGGLELGHLHFRAKTQHIEPLPQDF